ncbi:hypothetical protein AVEN_98194-1 [Araneus ventricosus]|uniref:Histone-lysine N-methyltransferase SETMAR n=1 Tax=Araneus ventricosus TaxID=182803 RepID=A0A4Y2HJ62_ARAVE|nr:hypothetical protein AVEN_98194-1 [Araneus ventricosus]
MQKKGESLMGQDRDCRPGDQSLPFQVRSVLLCPFLCGVLHYLPRTKPLEVYCHACSLVISMSSFGIHFHLFPVLKSALSGRHFRSNEEVLKAVKNFLRSLGNDFYQDSFFKLISRYDKCIMSVEK